MLSHNIRDIFLKKSVFRCASISCFQVVSKWVSQWVSHTFLDLQSIQFLQSQQSQKSQQSQQSQQTQESQESQAGVEQNFVLWQELPEFSFFSFLFAMVQFARSNLWIKQTLSAINFDTFHVWSNLYAIIPEYLK